MKFGTLFITGAGGFLGPSVVAAALRAGYRVVALLHHNTGLPETTEQRKLARQRKILESRITESHNLQIVTGCLNDANFVNQILRTEKVDAVIHMAGITNVMKVAENLQAAMHANVNATEVLATAANNFAIQNRRLIPFIFISTIRVPQVLEKAVNTGETPIFRCGYTRSKYIAEKVFENLPGLSTVIFYSTNLIGVGDSDTVVPVWVRNALKGDQIPIMGDGSTIIEFLSIDSFCGQLLKLLVEHNTTQSVQRHSSETEFHISLEKLAQTICVSMDRIQRKGLIANSGHQKNKHYSSHKELICYEAARQV